jgi:hypothetical protein
VAGAALAAAAALAPCPAARAQAIEPRQFSNAPVGFNFLVAGFSRSSGGIALDPSVPFEDASLKVDAPFIGYVRALDVAGKSGKIQVVVPYASLAGRGVFGPTGEVLTRDVNGFGDPAVRFAVNFHGAPALAPEEFVGYRQNLIVGASLQVTAPLGQYDPDRLVNIGTNRWSLKPEVGIAKALGRWVLEGTGGASFYTDNDDFFGGHHRSQDPIYSLQGHVICNLPRRIWVALDGTYYWGGRTTVDGVRGNDLQQNWRVGFTLALAVTRRNSLKIYLSDGVYTRIGENAQLAGVGWQYRWGGGVRRG